MQEHGGLAPIMFVQCHLGGVSMFLATVQLIIAVDSTVTESTSKYQREERDRKRAGVNETERVPEWLYFFVHAAIRVSLKALTPASGRRSVVELN